MPAIDKQLQELEEGDIVQGGTFFQALSDEPVDWLVVERYNPVTQAMLFSAEWLGVPLGSFRLTKRGCERVD